MTMTIIDLDRPYTQVGGSAPLAYMQAGFGFDARLNCLGRFTGNGELIEEEAQAEEKAEEPERRKPGRPRNPR